MRCWYPKWLRLCYFEGAFILQLDQICHAQFLLSISKTMVTKATSTMSFPSKAWHLVATSLAPPWVRWWKRTSCLTHPAQLRNWRGSFPAMLRIHGAPSRACGLPPGGWRYGSVLKKRYFRWRVHFYLNMEGTAKVSHLSISVVVVSSFNGGLFHNIINLHPLYTQVVEQCRILCI